MSKKLIVTLTIAVLGVAAISVFGLIVTRKAAARTTVPATATVQTGITLPNLNIYTLTSDNTINILIPGTNIYVGLGRVPRGNGNLINIDFRPADGDSTKLYGVTDLGRILLIDLNNVSGAPTVISTLSPRFAGGVQSLMDFNPVANAIRLIGSNDQNFAVVNANGGNLNSTVVQTKLAYAAADVNRGVDPNICGGAYTNNFAGATNTIFYAIDYDLDTFVTIAPPLTATGSSNTGGGQLQTIGRVVTTTGARINFNSLTDFDIYTPKAGVNLLVGVNNMTMFTIDLAQINPNLPLGTTQTVVAKTTDLVAPFSDSFDDIAIPTPSGAVASR